MLFRLFTIIFLCSHKKSAIFSAIFITVFCHILSSCQSQYTPSPYTHFRKKYDTPLVDIREHPNTDFLIFKYYEVRTDREWSFGSRNPSVSTDMTQFFFQIDEMDMRGINQWQGKAARFTFSDIICYMREGNYAGLNQTLVRGDWMLEVPLKSTDTAVFAQAGQVISAFTPALEWFYDKEITFDNALKLYQDDVPDECDN